MTTFENFKKKIRISHYELDIFQMLRNCPKKAGSDINEYIIWMLHDEKYPCLEICALHFKNTVLLK
jgi:hypothetical protein